MGFSSQFALKSTQTNESEKQLDPKVKLESYCKQRRSAATQTIHHFLANSSFYNNLWKIGELCLKAPIATACARLHSWLADLLIHAVKVELS